MLLKRKLVSFNFFTIGPHHTHYLLLVFAVASLYETKNEKQLSGLWAIMDGAKDVVKLRYFSIFFVYSISVVYLPAH